MLRVTLLAVTVLSVAPAGATAALGQIEPVSVRGYDDCLQATGRPGELALPATDGVRFAQATRDGLKVGPPIELAKGFECGSVVSRANGAGVIAGAPRDDGAVVVSVREPGGGAWSAPVTIALEADWRAEVVRAAVSDRGDVIVSWRESQRAPSTSSLRRVRLARRSPGGAFGAVEPLGEVANRHELVLPAIAATGEAFVLTTTAETRGSPSHAPLSVWTAGPGAAFGAPGTVGSMRRLHAPAIAAAADGRVLVAWSDGASLHVTEREPGGTFAAPVRLGDADERSGFAIGVTVGPAGEAAVGWLRFRRGEAQIASRRTPGAFGPPTRAAASGARADGDAFFDSEIFEALYFGGGSLTYDEHPPNPVLTSDGRATLAWSPPGRVTAALTSAPVGGGDGSSAFAGRALNSVDVVHGLALADGTPAIAWTEPVSESRFRLHLAADGVQERPQPAPPRVTVGPPRAATLGEDEPLRLPISCSRPCVVFAGLGDTRVNGAFVTLPRGGRGELKFDGAALSAPRPAGPVTLTVRYRSPDALRARSRTLRVRIARGADVPHPRVTDLRAVRRGGSIRVSWRVGGPIAKYKWPFVITADLTRAAAGRPVAVRLVEGNRRRYSVTLRASADTRYVTVRTGLEGGRSVVRID